MSAEWMERAGQLALFHYKIEGESICREKTKKDVN